MPRAPLWPERDSKPPFGATELDRGHPLASGLFAAFFLTEGAGDSLYDHVTGVRAPFFPGFGSPTWRATAAGPAVSDPIISFRSFERTAWPTALPISLHVLSAATTGDNLTALMTVDVSVGFGQKAALGWNRTAGTAVINYVGVGNVFGSSVGVGAWTHMTGVFTSSSARALYLNGIPDVSDATAGTAWATPDNVNVGDIQNGNLKADISIALGYGRALSIDDMLWLVSEPYAMLRPIVRRRYFVPAVSGGSTPTRGAWKPMIKGRRR